MEAQTQFEYDLWHDGKRAMLFNLEDDAVISIIKKCIDNREIDKNCRMETLKDNLIPISEVKNFMEYIARYDAKVFEECFIAIVSISKQHRFAFKACATMYVADKGEVSDERIDKLKDMLREYGILDYMEQFNKCMEHILNNGIDGNDK